MRKDLKHQDSYSSDYPQCGKLIISREDSTSGYSQKNDKEKIIEEFFESLRQKKNLDKVVLLLEPFETTEPNPNSPYFFEQLWYAKDDLFKKIFGIDKNLFSKICQNYSSFLTRLLEPYILKYTDFWEWGEYIRFDRDKQNPNVIAMII